MMTARDNRSGWTLRALLGGIVDVAMFEELPIDGLCIDSRVVTPGDLFLCCSTDSDVAHGHISEAARKGAVAVVAGTSAQPTSSPHAIPVIATETVTGVAGLLADRYYGQPSHHMRVIGVTGTNGKTSVSHFIAHALSGGAGEAKCGLLGTLGYGLFGSLRAGLLTTPDVLTVHRELACLRAAGVANTVMEVSSHSLEQQRVAAVNFDFAVFTNLTRDHLDYHSDMGAYGAAKQKLFARDGLRAAIVNSDDEFGRSLIAATASKYPVYAYSLGGPDSLNGSSDSVIPVCGRVVAAHRYSLALGVSTPSAQADFCAPVVGRFNASNILAAVGTLLACGMDLRDALSRLSNLPVVPGRMECVGGAPGQPLVVVDYSHTPDSLHRALEALRERPGGRLWCVFGCGGDRDRGKRAQMAAAAAEWADELVITDDNPRTENGDVIVEDIRTGLPSGVKALVLRDRARAIRHVIESATSNDTILVAGKGHESYQEIGGERYPFSDVAVVTTALLELGS